jgi:hypothetical protein
MPYQLHYFTLRLWLEVVRDEQVEWRGELRNTSTGEIRYFRQGPMLLDILSVMMAAPKEGEWTNLEGAPGLEQMPHDGTEPESSTRTP